MSVTIHGWTHLWPDDTYFALLPMPALPITMHDYSSYGFYKWYQSGSRLALFSSVSLGHSDRAAKVVILYIWQTGFVLLCFLIHSDRVFLVHSYWVTKVVIWYIWQTDCSSSSSSFIQTGQLRKLFDTFGRLTLFFFASSFIQTASSSFIETG